MDDPSPLTDGELVEAARAGDPDAFDALYARYEEWIAFLAYRFSGNHEDALDVLQETFSYFIKKLPTFELRSQLKTFFYPVVKHLALARKSSAHRLLPLTNEANTPSSEGNAPRVSDLVGGLSEIHREVILLRFTEGLELKEIAHALSVPVGTVKSRLHHALRILREEEK